MSEQINCNSKKPFYDLLQTTPGTSNKFKAFKYTIVSNRGIKLQIQVSLQWIQTLQKKACFK